MTRAALLDHHGHDSIFIGLSAFLVNTNYLVDPDVANKISCDEHKVGSDDPVCVDVSHGISWRERLFGSHDGYNFQAGTGLGPFGVSGDDES
jgi:hypothetical protein